MLRDCLALHYRHYSAGWISRAWFSQTGAYAEDLSGHNISQTMQASMDFVHQGLFSWPDLKDFALLAKFKCTVDVV